MDLSLMRSKEMKKVFLLIAALLSLVFVQDGHAANIKISELTAIGTVDPAVDVLPVVDTSAGATRKITPYQIVKSVGSKVCKTITNPADTDNLLFQISDARTVTKVWGLAIGGTSVVATLQDAGADGSGSTTIESLTVLTTVTTSTSIDSATLHEGDIVKLDIGTVTGTVTQVMFCYE
jgi:hypothetical protein